MVQILYNDIGMSMDGIIATRNDSSYIIFTQQMFPHPPLRSRVLKSKDTKSAPMEMAHRRLPYSMEYKSWDMSTMQQAIAEVERGMPQRKAAEIYRVPRSTLGDYVRGSSSLSSRSGCPLLTMEEEEELATFLVEMAAIGYPHTSKQVIAKVQQIVNSKGRDGSQVTNGWWHSYRKRHPKLTLKKAVPLSYNRAKASDPGVLTKYYDMLYKCLEDGGILNKPSAIYNCDESGLPLNPTSQSGGQGWFTQFELCYRKWKRAVYSTSMF